MEAAGTTAEEVSERPVPPSDADSLEAEPAETSLPRTGLAGLVHRVAIGLRLRRERAPEALSTAVEATPKESLPLRTRAYRAVRSLREGIALRRRQRTFALSVEAGVVRVVVFEKQEIVAWGSVDPREGDAFHDDDAMQPDEADKESAPALQSDALEPGGQTGQEQTPSPGADEAPDTDASESEEGEDPAGHSEEDRFVIAAMGSLMEELRARRARLVIDLPLYIPLVRHLKLPPVRRRFLEPVLISEIAGAIPFAEHEVDIKWHAVKDGDSSRALAIAVQKDVVDSHVRRMKDAGQGPVATYSQAAALALAAGVSDAMVVHLARDRESVVLVRDGAPQVVLQVWSPEGASTSEDRA